MVICEPVACSNLRKLTFGLASFNAQVLGHTSKALWVTAFFTHLLWIVLYTFFLCVFSWNHYVFCYLISVIFPPFFLYELFSCLEHFRWFIGIFKQSWFIFAAKIQSKCSQIASKIQSKFSQNTSKIQSKYIQNTVKMQSKCSQNAVKIQSKFSQNSVKIQSKYIQNSVKIQSICSQNSAKMQSKCSQNSVKIQSKRSQTAVEMQSKRSQNAVKIHSLLGVPIDWKVFNLVCLLFSDLEILSVMEKWKQNHGIFKVHEWTSIKIIMKD